MTSTGATQPREIVFRAPGEGRTYPCGSMQAVFKADGEETASGYSVSEWWLDPHSDGVSAHHHETEDELFLVLEGTVTFVAGAEEIDAPRGSILLIPARVRHGFRNRTSERAGVLNVFIGGEFESRMPEIVSWYAAQRSIIP